MSRRVHLISEFVAHDARVNCAKLSNTQSGLLLTGGDDTKVNVWAAASAHAILTLSGNSSAIECVGFDGPEDIIGAGAATGSVKLWNLETGKLLRTLTGHRSNCQCLDFHPFGDFCLTGSLDTNVKIWDTRRKGCIQTFKEHNCPISTVKFTPDGKLAVSGDKEGKVKVWDLQAGRLLQTISQHTSVISSIAFHPNELLMATGSGDRTVRFWDMDNFENIGIAGPDAVGVRSMVFSPCGSVLLSGYQDSLRVYGYEPVQSYDVVDVNWQKIVTLAYFNADDDAAIQLLGCALHQQCVSLWSVDLANVNPFGTNVPNRENFLKPKPERTLKQQPIRPGGNSNNGSSQAKNTSCATVTAAPSRPLATVNGPFKVLHTKNTATIPRKLPEVAIYEMNKQFRNAEPGEGDLAAYVKPSYTDTPESIVLVSPRKKGQLGHGEDMPAKDLSKNGAPAAPARELCAEEKAMAEIMDNHRSLRGILSRRLSDLQALRGFWQRGDHSGAMSLLSSSQDDSLTADYARAAVTQNISSNGRESLPFGILPLALPLFNTLLESDRAPMVLQGLRVIHSLLRTYGSIVSTTLRAPAIDIGVDLSREERIQRYRSAAKAFADVRPNLETVNSVQWHEASSSEGHSEIGSLSKATLKMHDEYIVSIRL